MNGNVSLHQLHYCIYCTFGHISSIFNHFTLLYSTTVQVSVDFVHFNFIIAFHSEFSGGSKIFHTGAPTPGLGGKTYLFNKIFPENERILTKKGAHVLGSANKILHQHMHRFHYCFEVHNCAFHIVLIGCKIIYTFTKC